jgi:sugar phosphate isomerase/epimerase
MPRFKVGLDNYGLYPLKLSPLEILKWAMEHGADGVAFSGLSPDERKYIDRAYLRDLSQNARENNLYLEWGGGQHIPRDITSSLVGQPFLAVQCNRKDIFSINEQAAIEAEQLGTRLVRSCSGGLMRWNPDNPPTLTLLRETAEALKNQRSMLRGHNVILAIETHFEFTTFELLRLFDMCEAEPGDWLGICLDTMNLLTMLEDPVIATRRILPWVVSTHIKDGGILLDETGFTTFPVAIGNGIVDFQAILALLGTLAHDVNLSVEDHGGDFKLPIFNQRFLSEFPDLTVEELHKLVELSQAVGQAFLPVNQKTNAECKITARESWGEVCEKRIAGNINSLKTILSRMNGEARAV